MPLENDVESTTHHTGGLVMSHPPRLAKQQCADHSADAPQEGAMRHQWEQFDPYRLGIRHSLRSWSPWMMRSILCEPFPHALLATWDP